MGVPKTKWSSQEEAALVTGVKKFGIGKWRLIQKDPELGDILRLRSNVDLKDKWRNMHPQSSGPKEVVVEAEGGPIKVAKRPATALAGPHKAERGAQQRGGGGAGPSSKAAAAAHAAAVAMSHEKTLEVLVFEAVRTLKAAATVDGIAVHIEAGYDVPPMFRKQLAAHLKSLHEAGRLVMNKAAYALPGRGQGQKPGFDVKLAGFRNKPGGKVPEFLVNGKRLTAEEMAEDAARALQAAEEAAAAAEAAAREAEEAEMEARRLQNGRGMGVFR